MRVTTDVLPEPRHHARLCSLTVEGHDDGREIADLLESLDAFQSSCRAGFFTAQTGEAGERYIALTSRYHELALHWDLSHRVLDAGVEEALRRLLLYYQTGTGPSLMVRMHDVAEVDDRLVLDLAAMRFGESSELRLPFQLTWDMAMPLGSFSQIRVEFAPILSDQDADQWLNAIRSWERITLRNAFGDRTDGVIDEEDRKQVRFSELFMLSPSWLELTVHGFPLGERSLAALLRFFALQCQEHRIICGVEILH
jgi:hypothetical protein